jgi:hypothetical protein
VVDAPLALWVGLNDPQLELAQLTDQSTPALVESLLTVARAWPVVPAWSGEMGGVSETEIGGAEIVITALTAWFLSAAEVAVIVTLLPGGALLGAVKTVGELLTV